MNFQEAYVWIFLSDIIGVQRGERDLLHTTVFLIDPT